MQIKNNTVKFKINSNILKKKPSYFLKIIKVSKNSQNESLKINFKRIKS